MKDRFLNNLFPVSGGSIGAISPVFLDIMTWHSVGDLALRTAILAFVGGLIGWCVKHALDRIFKKKK